MNDLTTLSNSELDAAYAAYFDAGDKASAVLYASEIAQRKSSWGGFFTGLIGNDQFPLYDARLGQEYGVMSQSDSAQAAVKKSASDVANKITLWGGSTLIVAALLGVVFLVIVYGKKP